MVVSIFNRVLYKLLDKPFGLHCSMRGLVFLRKPFAACDFLVYVCGGGGGVDHCLPIRIHPEDRLYNLSSQ